LEATSFTSNHRFWFRSGFGDRTAINAGDSYIGMRTQGSTVYGNWSNGSSSGEITLTSTISANTQNIFEIKYNGTSGVVRFYINGVYQTGKDLTTSSMVAAKAVWEMQLFAVNQATGAAINFVLGDCEFLQEHS